MTTTTKEEFTEDAKMNLLSLPIELIDGNILPNLAWNDLLRLRRVCKATKDITEGYMKVHPELAPEIEINEEDKSFSDFLRMGIPTTKIFLNNISGDKFYEQAGADGDEFLENCGPLVTHLRVEQISRYIYGKEWDFLDALINLQSFEAQHFGCGKPVNPAKLNQILTEKYKLAQQDPRSVQQGGRFQYVPNALKQLKSVKIGNNEDINFPNIIKYTAGFLNCGLNLEYVSLPFSPDITPAALPIPGIPQQPLFTAFMLIELAFQDRATAGAPLTHLNAIDFYCYPETYYGHPDQRELGMEWNSLLTFAKICMSCVENNVKLMNVPSHWFMRREEFPEMDLLKLGSLVVSFVNLHPSMLSMKLDNLERIVIRQTSRSSPGPNWREKREDWPSLKCLDITADSKTSSSWSIDLQAPPLDNNLFAYIRTKDLFQFFFHGVTRAALVELRLDFIMEPGKGAVPKTEDIVASCPNLKKLTIINWPGTNKALAKLWTGLSGLEEVSLEYCEDLGNVAFVGEDANSPVFLKLTKLKKLSLKGLDYMPKITDTLFSLVIRHMKLTQLTLTSEQPLKMVTKSGIESLLDGCFTDSIGKFPFKDWSLANVSVEEFKKMERKFQSYYML